VVEVTAIGGDVDAQLKGSHQTHGNLIGMRV
jgi:hypothetical protein